MKSCIYTGHIGHRRHKPVKNNFRYGLFMLYLDLDELPSLFDDCSLWSYERSNLAGWRRKNYLGPRDLSLREAVRFRIEDAGLEDPGGSVCMLTHATYFGLCYNPVSFYYCFDKAGKNVEIIIAEINNIPWKERHAYVMSRSKSINGNRSMQQRFTFAKVFHVSPFMPMNVDYDWSFSNPGASLNIHMEDIIEGVKCFEANLSLSREEITPSKLNAVLLRYPFMTGKAIAGIYYQAFRLWLKRTPFYENPQPRPKGITDFYDTVETAMEHKKNENKLD